MFWVSDGYCDKCRCTDECRNTCTFTCEFCDAQHAPPNILSPNLSMLIDLIPDIIDDDMEIDSNPNDKRV